MTLDPRTHAVRADLADVRLAERVFAPHYAAAAPYSVASRTPLRATRAAGSEVLIEMQPGAAFEMLDHVGGDAWGIAVAEGVVGYCDAAALVRP